MCAKECMLSKNVQGFCFFPVFSKAIHKTNYKPKSLKFPEAMQLMGDNVGEFFWRMSSSDCLRNDVHARHKTQPML